ncbi:hypothetical protein CEXT_748591 [Caerostris extrusa]|uniref:Uncharacterized protein n=1 Tax=Caerostris extrusa TaxID=172846 RepID=A0AAV4Y695_CAEEX|nr:hypothetical protein CEXT_748591 [Caerostris extrusa]
MRNPTTQLEYKVGTFRSPTDVSMSPFQYHLIHGNANLIHPPPPNLLSHLRHYSEMIPTKQAVSRSSHHSLLQSIDSWRPFPPEVEPPPPWVLPFQSTTPSTHSPAISSAPSGDKLAPATRSDNDGYPGLE